MMKAKLRFVSHGARAAVARVRQRPYAAGSAVFAAALLSIGVLASGFEGPYSANAAMAARSSDDDAVDMDSLLDARSPGGRRYGWLTDSKPARLVNTPTERVLSSVRSRPPVAGTPAEPASFAPPALLVDDVPVGPAGISDVIGPDGFPTGPVGEATGPGTTPGGVVPPGGSPGGPTDNPPANPPVEPLIPAVPEPATWAMLVMGFAILGTGLRRRGMHLRLHGYR